MINVVMQTQGQRCQLFAQIFRYAFISNSVVKLTTNIYEHMNLDAKMIEAFWQLCMIMTNGIREEGSRIEYYYASSFR